MTAVLALDLSLASTGVAHVDGTLSLIRTKADGDVIERRADIADQVAEYVQAERPDLIVIEAVPPFGSKPIVLAHLHGVVLDRIHYLGHRNIRMVTSDQRAGFATMNPKAKKDQVVDAALAAGAPIPTSPKAGRDDLADAYWLRQIGLGLHGEADVELLDWRHRIIARLTGAA